MRSPPTTAPPSRSSFTACPAALPNSPPAASPTHSSMAISIPAISAATGARSPCSTGATAASVIPCWTSRPSSSAFPAMPSRPSASTGCGNGATPSRAPIPPAPRSCSPPSPPPAEPRSIAASSIASSRPSTPTTGTTPPNGCSARPPSSANSGFSLDFYRVSCHHVLCRWCSYPPTRYLTSCIGSHCRSQPQSGGRMRQLAVMPAKIAYYAEYDSFEFRVFVFDPPSLVERVWGARCDGLNHKATNGTKAMSIPCDQGDRDRRPSCSLCLCHESTSLPARWTWGRSLESRSGAGSDRLDQPAIHPHERTRNIGRRRARQERHHGGELFRLAVASQWDRGPGLGGDRGHIGALPLGVGGVDLVDPLGMDAAGHHAVDGDAMGGHLVRQALRPA